MRRDGSQTSSDDSICLCFSLGFGKPLPVMPRFYLDRNGQKKRKSINKMKEQEQTLDAQLPGFLCQFSHLCSNRASFKIFFSSQKIG